MGISDSDRSRCADICGARSRPSARRLASARGWTALRALAIAATACLAACAQPAVIAEKPDTEVVTAPPAEPEAKPARKPKSTGAANDRAAETTGKPTARQ